MKNLIACGTLALVLAIRVAAQDRAVVSYEDAMRCAALYAVTTEVVGADDPATIAVLEDRATRWIAMAMLRDGENGARADREIDEVVARLAETLASLAADAAAQTRFANEQFARCDTLEDANEEEFESFELGEE